MTIPSISNLYDYIQSLSTESIPNVRIVSDDQFVSLMDGSLVVDPAIHTVYIIKDLTCQDMQTILHTYALYDLPHSIINIYP